MIRSTTPRWLLAAGGIAVGLALQLFSAADETPRPPEPAPDADEIVQREPDFYVKVDVDRASREYREGDNLGISVLCEVDAYIYALYKQADGKVYQIYPNSGQPNNRVKAKTKVAIPGGDDRFVWKISGPFGKESIKVIASKEPLKNLTDPALREKRFNPVSKQLVKALAANLKDAEPPTWTEDVVEITTHDKSWVPPPPPANRYGVFFGVGKHKYDDLYRAVANESLNRTSNSADAVVLNRALTSLGKLDDSRVYVDEEATRQAIEEAITQWLPSVSKPGDTIFIFFGGHGDMLFDKRTGRGRLGYLLPHDFVGTAMVAALNRRKGQQALTEREQNLLAEWSNWLRGASNTDEYAERLARRTGVTDDLFGHWLQRLAGRQVVVLLASCHSGGFADEGKSLNGSGAETQVSFRYLEDQLTRLNGLGQGEVARLAACGSKETSLSYRLPDEKLKSLRSRFKGAVEDALPDDTTLSVYSYFVFESILTDDAPLRIETTFERCRQGTADYLEKVNAKIRADGEQPIQPYAPQLFKKNCQRPVLMKPE